MKAGKDAGRGAVCEISRGISRGRLFDVKKLLVVRRRPPVSWMSGDGGHGGTLRNPQPVSRAATPSSPSVAAFPESGPGLLVLQDKPFIWIFYVNSPHFFFF